MSYEVSYMSWLYAWELMLRDDGPCDPAYVIFKRLHRRVWPEYPIPGYQFSCDEMR